MKKSLAKKWVNALRGGDFKQGREGYLYDSINQEYCCLGVLDKINGSKEHDLSTLCCTYIELGLNCPCGTFHSKYGDFNLVDLNDRGLDFANTNILEFMNQPFTFDEIADLVQIEYIEGLW